MRRRWLKTVAAVCSGLLLGCGAIYASSDMQGSAEVLYRNVSQEGSVAKYNEDFDGLNSGFRLGNVRLSWDAIESNVADYARISFSGLGGDPYQSASMAVGRQDVYDLKFNYFKQTYIYDLFAVSPDLDGSAWNTQRGFSNLDFRYHATPNVTVVAGFKEVDRRGTSIFMKDIIRDVFRLDTPLDQTSRRYTAGVDLKAGTVDIIFRQEVLNNDFRFTNMTSGNTGLNTGNSSVLNSYNWAQKDRTNSNLTTLKLHSPIGNRVDVSVSGMGTLLGDEEMKSDVLVNSDGIDQNGNAFTINGGFAHSDVKMKTLVASADVAVRILDQLNFILEYNGSRRNATGTSKRELDADPNALINVEPKLDYKVDTIGGVLEYRPITSLNLRGGYKTTDRKLNRDGNIEDPVGRRNVDFESNGDVTWNLGAAWRPVSWVRLNASYEDGDRDMPFTRISLLETKRYMFQATVKPIESMSVAGTYSDFQNRNHEFDSKSDGTSWSLAVTHKANAKLDYMASYATQRVSSATPIIFDIAGGTGFGNIDTGDSNFDTDYDEATIQVNYAFTPAWKSFIRYTYSKSNGTDLFVGDTTGVLNNEILKQRFSDAEVGLTRYFQSGIFIGGSFRTFDYNDENDVLEYNGQIFLFRSGVTF